MVNIFTINFIGKQANLLLKNTLYWKDTECCNKVYIYIYTGKQKSLWLQWPEAVVKALPKRPPPQGIVAAAVLPKKAVVGAGAGVFNNPPECTSAANKLLKIHLQEELQQYY